VTGVKKNFLKLTLDKSHFITENYGKMNYLKKQAQAYSLTRLSI